MSNATNIKLLYAIPIIKDSYGLYRMTAVLEDDQKQRYLWITNSSSKGLEELKDKEDFCRVSFVKIQDLNGGDIQIERLRVLKNDDNKGNA